MSRAIHLLPFWAFVACYRESFTFTFYLNPLVNYFVPSSSQDPLLAFRTRGPKVVYVLFKYCKAPIR